MTGITQYASHRILNYIFKRTSFIMPTTWYVGVSTTPVGTEGSGLREPLASAGYRRLAIPNNKLNFTVAANKIVSLAQALVFNEATANWGNVTHYIIADAITNGNIWFYGNLQAERNVEADTTLMLRQGTNSMSFDICEGPIAPNNTFRSSTSDMAVTTYFSNRILDYVFGLTTYTPPATYYIGLSTVPPSIEGIGAIEPGGNYRRLAIPNNQNTFAPASNKQVTFAQTFSFDEATSPWGVITHYIIADAQTGGNILWAGKLKLTRNAQIGTTLTVRPGDFIWQLDNCNRI